MEEIRKAISNSDVAKLEEIMDKAKQKRESLVL